MQGTVHPCRSILAVQSIHSNTASHVQIAHHKHVLSVLHGKVLIPILASHVVTRRVEASVKKIFASPSHFFAALSPDAAGADQWLTSIT